MSSTKLSLSLSSPSAFLKPLSIKIKPITKVNLKDKHIRRYKNFISKLKQNNNKSVYKTLIKFLRLSSHISNVSYQRKYLRYLKKFVPSGTPYRRRKLEKILLNVDTVQHWDDTFSHVLFSHGYTLHNLKRLAHHNQQIHKRNARIAKFNAHLKYINSTLPSTNYGLRVPKQHHYVRRTKLASLSSNHRYTFTGSYTRCGYKVYRTHYTPTLLLTNVHYGSHLITNHLWFNYTKGFRKLGQLAVGNRIQFNARVSIYLKGYAPVYAKTLDYDLSYPTKIRAIGVVTHQALPVNNTPAMVGYVMQKNKTFYINNDRPYSSFYVNIYKDWQGNH